MAYNPYYNPERLRPVQKLPDRIDPPQWLRDYARNAGNSQQPEQEEANGQISNYLAPALNATSLALDWKAMGDQANNIQTNAPQLEYDSDGAPVYNQGQFAVQTAGIKPQGTTAGEAISSIGKGAAIGAQFGGPLGGAIGGLLGGIGSIFGGNRRKRKMREAKRRAQRNLTRRQTQYNTSTEGYNQTRLARDQYEQSLNSYNRLYNLYNR